jgi:UDP-3-O-[3-hydroxymyristoyl] glucosamine N-acyltransferase
MADPRFFKRLGPFAVSQIAERCEAIVHDTAMSDLMIEDVATLKDAGEGQLAFLDNPKYVDDFKTTKASACLVHPDRIGMAPAGIALIVTKAPYKAYALAAQMFYPIPQAEAFISDHSVIDPSAKIAAGCRIEAGAVIGVGVELGLGCWIESNAVIGENVVIGRRTRIGANASISHAIIGNDVRIYPGARIGQDGFGFAIDPKGFVKVPQLGRVIIEDHVEIGANTCIDRGAGPDTVIGMGTWIDNQIQIGHNVKLGRGCVLAGQVGIAGSTEIGDFVAIGGQAGVAGHLKVGKGAQLAAGSGVISNIDAGEVVMGYPALPKTRFMRHVAYLNRATRLRNKSEDPT